MRLIIYNFNGYGLCSEPSPESILTDDDRYSRIPVYDETIDEIKGVVHIKDILLSTKNKNTKIKSLMKEAYFVPEAKPVNELFAELRKNKKSMAIIIDEYGGTSGIATMEDVLEEIVGEIYDEYDKVEKKFEKIDVKKPKWSSIKPFHFSSFNTFISHSRDSIEELIKNNI